MSEKLHEFFTYVNTRDRQSLTDLPGKEYEGQNISSTCLQFTFWSKFTVCNNVNINSLHYGHCKLLTLWPVFTNNRSSPHEKHTIKVVRPSPQINAKII